MKSFYKGVPPMTNTHRKYQSFEELINDFMLRDGIAICSCDTDGSVTEVSYKDFAEMIISESFHVKAACSTVEVIRYDQTVESIVDIFSHIIAGCDVIIADPRVAKGLNVYATAVAEAARQARESQRDSRGRIVGKQGEGEILFFTSGTTSRSKVVRLTSKALCASAWNGQSMLPCGKDDVILSVLSLSHAFGFVCSMLWGLAYGAKIALGRNVHRYTGDALFFRPTIIPAVPEQIAGMLRADGLNPELRIVLIGGTTCPHYIIDELRERGIDLYIGYGLTETASGVAITQDLDEPEAMYPCPEADIRIEDDGEISIATPCMMLGYVGREPMFDDGRFFTGDIGWFDDKGRLHLKGRKKDVLFMPDGSKIFCPEYEEELASLTGLPDLGLILKDGYAVLVVGSCSDNPKIAEDLRSRLVNTVEKYNRPLTSSQRIHDVIVRAESLPRTATGKIKRYELHNQLKSK